MFDKERAEKIAKKFEGSMKMLAKEDTHQWDENYKKLSRHEQDLAIIKWAKGITDKLTNKGDE